VAVIDVVSAIIVRDGRILLTQRMPPRDFAFCWESPGGKCEPDESFDVALRRELEEELDLRSASISPEQIGISVFPAFGVRVHLFPVEIDAGEKPRPAEGQGLGWFTSKDFERLDLAPCNGQHRTKLAHYIDGWRP
jgi:8-oxo-dGTP pyrophosphatase MutT (NUDIX family)